MRTIEINIFPEDHAAADKRRHKVESAGHAPCEMCGRKINPDRAWRVRVVDGGDVAHREDWNLPTNSRADMGTYPLGPECAKTVPIEYRRKYNEGF